jgi:hypothetical protein
VVTTAVCLLMILVDAHAGEEIEESEEAVCEFEGLLDASVAGDDVEDDLSPNLGIGLSVEPAPQIVPDPVPAGHVRMFEEDWSPDDDYVDAEIPDPFAESFRGKKGTPIAPEPEVVSTVEPVDDGFVIDELPDDPFFTPPTSATPPSGPARPGLEPEDDSERAGVRL